MNTLPSLFGTQNDVDVWKEFDKLMFPFGRHEVKWPSNSLAIDAHEDEKSITISADMPGLKKDDISVTLEDGILTIKGEQKAEKETQDKNYLRRERSCRSFSRQLVIDTEIDTEAVSAKYENGVLELKLPKTKSPSKEVKIEIAE